MKYGSLVFEKKDFSMIKRYQHLNQYIEDYAHKDRLEVLEENMLSALIVDIKDMPDDVIRMYSMVTVNSKWNSNETYQIVLPYEVDIENGKISVHSKLGASVIGLSEGDTIKHGLPGDILILKIEKVLQSEEQSKGDTPQNTIENLLHE